MNQPGPPPRKLCKRYNEPGHAHYLTFSCFLRQPFFSGQLAPQWFLDAVEHARRAEGFQLWAYVIMPEHAHLLICPGLDYSISRILRRIKKPFADRIIAYVRERRPRFLTRMERRSVNGRVSHHFWQSGGGYDRNLWTANDIQEKVGYIHMNPVRRGLVEGPEEWPWSSWRAWTEGGDRPLRIDRESVPVAGV